ncbi:hypothetical protein COLO4_18248 [Corchorus olitorius]|uniref:Peptidase M16 n=1 Tax=Corchorus olitorius TaxID=93759 RepID=A0A1R3J9Y2_9ROSI|nr:hypothetical protein COLO4_18248 [Corchorus olitorius]
MGSLPAEKSSSFTKMQSFRSLELLNVSLNQEINQQPFGVDHGRLENGLAYYVRRNPKPKNRAALALAVKVGSVLEEENERGVAHIIEHLAFSATKKYTNHNIVKFLESIGAEFGPCNNAYTSFDETVYEMLVPIDKPEVLSEAILVLAEFSSEIRLSKDDLEKERGAVMEEYRGGRNANGRIEDAHWALMMEGSKVVAMSFDIYPFATATSDLVRQSKAYMMSSYCKEKGTLEALESMLIEVARVRLHGFSEREISVVRALLLSSIESAYLERDQMESTDLRDEYVQHFVDGKPVIGIDCVIKIVEPRASAKIKDLQKVVMKINKLENERSIIPWDDEDIPEEIVTSKPSAGNIVKQLEYANIGATELILSNGMRVCYKCTDFSDDEVLISGFSYGGLSELPENKYFSCAMGSRIAEEVGVFGYKPSVLMDMLAGKRVGVNVDVGTYMRSFHGDCSPLYLETALQLVYQLFMTNVTPVEEVVKRVMQVEKEMILARERDPITAFRNRVVEVNYGNSYFFRPISISNLKKVDPMKACEYFNSCFKDPSTFNVVMVGNIDPTVALPLILQYLGGIPKPSEPISHFNSNYIKELPLTYPTTITREVVHSPMVEEQCKVHICIPIELKKGTMVEEVQHIEFLSKLLENKILQLLRFKHGQIYGASVYDFVDGFLPCINTDLRGDISISFSCDPKTSSKLVDLAIDEVLRLQEEGPTDEDVSTILEIEQRAHENGLQENDYWMDMILQSYQSRIYSGDIGTSFKILDDGRSKVRESLKPLTMQSALQRIVPFKNQHTVLILKPQLSLFKWLRSFPQWTPLSKDAKILVGIAGLTVLALSFRKYSQKS